MVLSRVLVGATAGFAVAAANAFVFNPGYDDSNFTVGTGVLGAAAGAVIGSCAAAVTLTYRWLRKPPGRSG